jgi:hypothetical protein
MFILFTNLFLARPFRLENTLECYNLRGGQGGSTKVYIKSYDIIYTWDTTPLDYAKLENSIYAQTYVWSSILHFSHERKQ